MSPVSNGNQDLSTRLPKEPATGEASPRLDIAVVFTSIEATLSALRVAASIGSRLRAGLTLVVPQVVSQRLSLTSPLNAIRFDKRHFRVLVGRRPVHANVRILPCRDREAALTAVLKPHSTVVIGDSRHWWASSERRFARKLSRAG